jgi:hypothetical protein
LRSRPDRRVALRRAAPWLIALALLGGGAVVRNLAALDVTPPGLYVDEASIGYNAWTVAHHGVDEHGISTPLYFEAFGEYKNPVYIYALVPLVRFLPLTPAVERVPAALFGLAALLFLTMAAWRLTRSWPITGFVLALGALTPWLVQESRVGFEVITIVAALSGVVWCLADERRLTPARFSIAGVLLMLAIFAYSTGRVEVLLFTIVLAIVYWRRRAPGWWLPLVPVGAGYLVLGIFALEHPGALTAEFSLISIGADGASLPTLAGRFLTNYIGYFSPDFLFIHGDPNPRHNTGYEGMLPAVMVPLLLAGLWECWRRRGEALPRFLVCCLVLGPVAASLTINGGAAHALRSAVMLPFLLLLAILGLSAIRDALRSVRHRALTAGLVAAGLTASLLVQGALYMIDLYAAYPARAATAFGTGVEAAIAQTPPLAGGHTVYLSTTFEQPYIQAFFALRPPPPPAPVVDDAGPGLRLLHMVVAGPGTADATAAAGDLLVLDAGDPPPQPAFLFPVVITESEAGQELVRVFRAS